MDWSTIIALTKIGSDLLSAHGANKDSRRAAALTRAQARYHAHTLRREAAYERINAQITTQNIDRLDKIHEANLKDLGQQSRAQLDQIELKQAASGFSLNSPAYMLQLGQAQQNIAENLMREGLEYTFAKTDLKIDKRFTLARAKDLEQDADATEKLGFQAASNIRAAGKRQAWGYLFRAGGTTFKELEKR